MVLRKYVYNYPNFYFFKNFGQISMAYAYVRGTSLCAYAECSTGGLK